MNPKSIGEIIKGIMPDYKHRIKEALSQGVTKEDPNFECPRPGRAFFGFRNNEFNDLKELIYI